MRAVKVSKGKEGETLLPLAERAAANLPAIAASPAASPAVAALPQPLPVAIMFPGQGSQYMKMLSGVKDLPAVKTMMEKANGILGFDLLELCLKGPESTLDMTSNAQVALYV